MASTPFNLDESNPKASITKIGKQEKTFDGAPYTSHTYEIRHPNFSRPVTVFADQWKSNPKVAEIEVYGDHEDYYNKLGTVEARRIARHIAADIGATHFDGIRMGGARAASGKPGYTKIKITERVNDDDEIYHTKDLEEFSQHLIDKHGAHVEMYWTPEGHVNLQTLIVPKKLRNQGIASNVINDIKRYSNKNKVKIILNAVPLDNSTESEKLINFYKSHGFVENKGRHKDYRLAGIDTMYHNHKEKKKKL